MDRSRIINVPGAEPKSIRLAEKPTLRKSTMQDFLKVVLHSAGYERMRIFLKVRKNETPGGW